MAFLAFAAEILAVLKADYLPIESLGECGGRPQGIEKPCQKPLSNHRIRIAAASWQRTLSQRKNPSGSTRIDVKRFCRPARPLFLIDGKETHDNLLEIARTPRPKFRGIGQSVLVLVHVGSQKTGLLRR